MREYFRLLPYLKSLWPKIIIGVILILMGSLFEGASITMLLPVIDKVFMAQTHVQVPSQGLGEIMAAAGETVTFLVSQAVEWAGQDDWLGHMKDAASARWDMLMHSFSRKDVLLFLCVLAIVIVLAKNLTNYTQNIIFIDVGQRMITNLRFDLYTYLQKFSLSFFNAQRSGDLISRLVNDVEVVNTFSIKNIVNLIRDLSSVVVFLSIAFMISFRLSLIVFVFFPPIFLVMGRIINSLKRYSRRSQKKIADLTYIIQETLSSIRIVKAFAMEEYEIERFREDNDRYRREYTRLRRRGALVRPLSDTMAMLVGVGLLWYGGMEIIDEATSITTGQFFVFLGALFSTMKPIKSIGHTLGELKRGTAAVERVLEIMDMDVDIKEIPNAVAVTTVEKDIEFENVTFAYKADTPVLRNISFRSQRGEITALVGPSGAGKTTLVDLIPRFYDPTDGRILIDGRDIRHMTLKSLRSLMGIVTQETILFNDTIFNNIAYGVQSIEPEQVYEAAKAANAHNFILEFREGYQTRIGERGILVSGGQRQRLAIARALFKNPPILIFDEATSALDSESEYLVQEAIDRLMQNRTVFVIAHRLSTIQNADRILVLENGQIVQQGSHQELIMQDGLYRKLSEMQFQMNDKSTGRS